MLEQKIQYKIIKKLENDDWLVLKIIKLSKAGYPDLMCLKDGKTMFIEVKQPNGKLSELQKVRIEQLKKRGFEVKVWIDFKKDFYY